MLHQHFLRDHVVQLVIHHFQEFDDQLDILDYQQQLVECQSCVFHHPFELKGYELQPIFHLMWKVETLYNQFQNLSLSIDHSH